MRTTLNIDEKLLDEAIADTGEKSRSKAVEAILREYLRRKKIDTLRRLAKEHSLKDDLREHRDVDIERQKRLDKLRGS
ncbi:MAG: ribbon-helix-helix protein, CopG family [SAR202 cluster bacterium]|nr:ribbon-helix-helix protein, CopG family [SAR202 cluster bacterium]